MVQIIDKPKPDFIKFKQYAEKLDYRYIHGKNLSKVNALIIRAIMIEYFENKKNNTIV